MIHDNNGLPLNDQQMSEEINNFFANVGTNLANKIPFIGNDNPSPPENLHIPTLMLDEITLNDVEPVLKRICVYKSSGLRLITSRIITTQIVFEYISDLYKNLDLSKETTPVYVNYRKAFDTFSHKILLNKLFFKTI